MNTYTISARPYEDGWLGFVHLYDREISMLAGGFLTEREALAAADKKRAVLESEWQKRLESIRQREPFNEAWAWDD